MLMIVSWLESGGTKEECCVSDKRSLSHFVAMLENRQVYYKVTHSDGIIPVGALGIWGTKYHVERLFPVE